MNVAPTLVSSWQLRLLGGVQLSRGPQQITRWPSRAGALLLARLALWPERQHAREELVELLWPGVALDVGRNRLRQALSTLRALLEPPGQPAVIVADRLALRLAPGALDCDVAGFEHLLRAGRLAEAAQCYRGELMPGYYDEWVDLERLRLASLAERALAAPVPAPVPAAAPALRPVSPDTASLAPRVALPAYLTRYFGGEPQAARLRGRLLAHRLVTLVGPGGSGKTRLAVEVVQALRQPPGWPAGPADAATGQTTTFGEMAFVPLVGCASAAQVADAIAAALHLSAGGPGQGAERLTGALGGRCVLLVLDNFEQLIGRAEPLLADLLAALPGLHLLVTSRRVLGIDGEQVVVIEPLPLPEAACTLEAAAGNPAVGLFVDRARAARADFHLGARNRVDIVALLRVLEGMPLAIELAAARVRAYSVGEMLQVLRPAPGATDAARTTPALDLLARGGPRGGLDARHASMLATIEWSWNLLGAGPRALLAGLTVFRGGCTAAAVRAVAAGEQHADGDAAHRQLDELLAHSLMHGRCAADGSQRFFVYEPIREFAAAQLATEAAADWRARHRAWLLGWAAALPVTPDLLAVRAEMPNLEAGLASAVADGAAGQAVLLLLQLRRVLEDVELPAQAMASAEAAVAACAEPLLKSRGQSLLGPLLLMAGRGDAALALAEAGLAGLAGDVAEVAEPHGKAAMRGRALHSLARVRWRRHRDPASVLPLIDEAQALADTAADRELQAGVLALRASVVNAGTGDHAAAYALHARALALWRQLGNRHAVHSGLYNLAVTEQHAGRHEATLELLAQLRKSARELHDWRRLSQADNVAGNALSELRRWPEAAQSLRDALRQAWRSMAPYEMAYPLWNLPRALAHLRQPEAALKLAAFAAVYWQAGFGALNAADHHDLRRVRRLAACQLDARRCQALWAEGEALDLAGALALAG